MNGALVIGSGPAGLAVTACLRRQGVDAHIVDRYGQPGGAYQRMYSGITMSSPAPYISLPFFRLKTKRDYVTVPEFRDYLDRYSSRLGVAPDQKQVDSLSRENGGYRVRLSGERHDRFYRSVVVATGMCDHPRWPDIPGLPKLKPRLKGAAELADGPQFIHAHHWRGPEAFRGQRLLIVGGGMRAVEIAEECARAGLSVVVSARQKKVKVLPGFLRKLDLRNLYFPLSRYANVEAAPRFLRRGYCEKRFTFNPIDNGYNQFRRRGAIVEKGETTAFQGDYAIFRDGSQQSFDVVVLATGYRFATPFLPKDVQRTSVGFPRTKHGQSVSWPGLFFLGIPCARTFVSQFIHGIVRDAPLIARSVRRKIERW